GVARGDRRPHVRRGSRRAERRRDQGPGLAPGPSQSRAGSGVGAERVTGLDGRTRPMPCIRHASSVKAESTRVERMRVSRHTVDLAIVAAALALSAGQLNDFFGPAAAINQVALAGLYLLGLFFLALNWHHALPVAVRSAPIWLLLGYLFLSITWSSSPTDTFVRSLALLWATLFGLYAAIRLNVDDLIACTAVGLCAVLVLSLVFAACFPSQGFMPAPHEGALRGIFSQKNTLARAAVWSTIALVMLRPRTRPRRVLRQLGIAISILSLLWAASRTGSVILVFLLILAPALRLLRRSPLVAIPVTVVAVVVATGLTLAALGNRSALLELVGRDATLT